MWSSGVKEVGKARPQISVTGFVVRVSVPEIGGVRVEKTVVSSVEGSMKGLRLLERLEPRASVQTRPIVRWSVY